MRAVMLVAGDRLAGYPALFLIHFFYCVEIQGMIRRLRPISADNCDRLFLANAIALPCQFFYFLNVVLYHFLFSHAFANKRANLIVPFKWLYPPSLTTSLRYAVNSRNGYIYWLIILVLQPQ